MGRKEEAAVPLSGGTWVPILHSVAWAEVYRCTKWNLDPSSRLAGIEMAEKWGCSAPC